VYTLFGSLPPSSCPSLSRLYLKVRSSQALVAQACNPSYRGGWDGEDHSSRSAQANSLQDPISKITTAKWIGSGSVAQVVEHLLCKQEALSSNYSPIKRKKKKRKKGLEQLWMNILYKNLFILSSRKGKPMAIKSVITWRWTNWEET
jgi:hypothetical protein